MRFDTPTRAAAFMARTSFRACASFALIHLLANPAAAQSIAGASVGAGSATISGVGSTNVTIAQTSDKAVIDWRAFSVDAGTTVTFRQPGTASIALNRITGSGTTRIDGSLVANGQVWLLNPNGVLIGAGGSVAAGGFLASTHAISNADFMAGNYQLTGDGSGAGVTNLGSIVAAEGGYAVLAGNHVANAGLVQARLGQVVLGAGKTFVLDVVGDKLLSFAVSEPLSIVASSGPLVDNRGVLAAQGGQVLLTARAAAGVVGSVINTSGLIDATAVSSQGGTIVLDGGTVGEVDATGLLTVSGLGAGQTGGTIQAFGDTVVAGDYAALDARGSAGGGSIYLGGGWQGASIGGHASAVRAGVASTAVLDASAIDSGNGGTVELWSDVTNPYSQTLAYGGFYARGGANGGDGGRIETSGHYLDTTGVTGSASSVLGKAGLWLFDPYDVEIVAAAGNSPTIVNSGFEDGLTGWTPFGTGGSETTTTSQVGKDNVTYLSQVGGSFALLGGGAINSANGISQTFTGIAGQSFNLYALFLGREAANSSFNDSTSVTLTLTRIDGTTSTQTLYSKNIAAGGATSTVPWQQQLVTLPETGSYTITASSTNIGDSAVPSQLGFELAVSNASLNGAFAPSGFGQTWTPTATASKIDVSQITGFLNAGTNVQITTTGAGTEAGNITVNAAIAKTAGAAATLQLDALGGIIVNQAIGSTSNALNVTLNAGAGGIALNAGVATNGGTLALNTTGATTQTAALTTSGLTLNGAGGAYALTNAANNFATLSGSTGSIAVTNAATSTTLAALTTTGNLTINTTGTVGQTAALSAATLALNGVGTQYTLTNTGNTVATLSGSTGSIALTDASALSMAGLTTSGALTVNDIGNLTIAGAVSVGATSQLTASQAVTIANGGQIAASAGTLALVAGTNFSNQAGANAITGAARWLVYSQGPAGDTFGGLLSGNTAIWGTPASTAPSSIAQTGNRYVFALSPTITVTPTATRKTYGDTLTAAGVAYTTSGLINAATYGNAFTQDVLTGAPGVDGSYGGFAPTSYTGTYQLHSTQGTLATTSGYTFAFGQSTLTVDPKALLLTALTDNRVYDRTTASSLTPTVSGLVNGDTISNLSQSFDSANAGNRLLTANTSYVISTTGGQTGSFNYTVTRASVAGTITAKALTAALTGSTTKTYDGTTTAVLPSSDYQLSGVIQGDTVALNNPSNGSYADRNVGTGKTVSVTGLALTGASAANYTVNATASASIGAITAKALTLAAVTTTKVYDGNTTSTAAATATGLVSGDTVSQLAEQFDSANAGNRILSVASGYAVNDGNGGANYAVTLQTASGNITQKTLTAGLTGSVSKIYDGTTAATLAAGNYTLTGGIVANDQVTLNNPVSGTYDTRNVGTGKVISVTGLLLTGSGATNYTVNASASAAIGAITAKALTLSAVSTTKVYDGNTTSTATATATGLVSGDTVSQLAEQFDSANAGNRILSVASGYAVNDGNGGNNYAVTLQTASGNITQKTLTAGLTGSVSKIYDGTTAVTLAAGNYTLTGGIVANDQVTLNNPVSGTYDTRNVGTAKTVSVTGLLLTGSSASNYTVNAGASAAIGAITAKALTAGLTGDVTKIYDGGTAATLAAGNYSLTGVVANDAVALNDPTAGTYDTKTAGMGKTVTVTGLALTGGDAGNYTVNAGTSAAVGTVTAKALTAGLTGSVAKTYDGSTAATLADGNYVLTGAVSGDAVALNDPAAGTYDTRNAGTGKIVAVTGLALTGTDAGNYTVNADTSGAIGSIAAKTLAATLTGSVAKTYDGSTTATLANGNYVLTGAVSGDAVALNDPTAGTYDTKNAGTGKTVAVTGLALGGADAGNYTVNAGTSAAIGSIAAKTLAATLTGSVAKTYDGSTAATLANGNYVLTGAVSGDAVALNNPTVGTYDTKNAGTGKTVAVTGLALNGADAGNYTVNAGASAAIGSVAAKALAASLTGSVAKTYDGSTVATLANGNYVLAGTVSGDAVALNNPTAGTYDTKNVGTAKTVAVTGIALTGADAGNYTVNAGTSAAIGSVAARALAVSLVGTVAKTANGGTDAALAADNFLLAGFVSGEGATVGKTSGDYANASAGTGIVVTTTLAAGDFAPTAGTALSNYVLPVGTVSGRIGTINPSIVIVTPTPATPPAAVIAAIAATAVLPATSVAVPVTPAADSASAVTVAVAAVGATVAISVDRSPPSPVAAQKPPTPVDAADAGDPILATVSEPPSEKPASHATRQTTVTVPIAGGLLAQQQTVPSRGNSVPGVDQAFSGGGGVF